MKDARVGIIVSEWNRDITDKLLEGCEQTLKKSGAKKKNIMQVNVPGSFELPSAAKILVEHKKLDAVICLGCIIQGETRHFEFISNAVANGIAQLNINQYTPVIFGVLTTDSIEQAMNRAGGNHGNKGVEAAVTAIRMVTLQEEISPIFRK